MIEGEPLVPSETSDVTLALQDDKVPATVYVDQEVEFFLRVATEDRQCKRASAASISDPSECVPYQVRIK